MKFEVNDMVSIEHGSATLVGYVVSADGSKVTVEVAPSKEGAPPTRYPRNAAFVTLIKRSPATPTPE